MYYWPLALIWRVHIGLKSLSTFFIPFHMKIMAGMYERLTSFRFVSFVTLWWKDHLVCRLFISNIYRFINKMWFMIWSPDQVQSVVRKEKIKRKRRIFKSLLTPSPLNDDWKLYLYLFSQVQLHRWAKKFFIGCPSSSRLLQPTMIWLLALAEDKLPALPALHTCIVHCTCSSNPCGPCPFS